MKVYAIFDKQVQMKPIGYLFYYEKINEYIIELQADLDEWDAPLLFQKYVREKRYTIPKDVAALWVRERVIPSGRQNIGIILKEAKLKEYNEMALLALSSGRCAQDSCYIKEVDYEAVPEDIVKRSESNVTECFSVEHGNIICLFQDNLVRKISLEKLKEDYESISHVLRHSHLQQTVEIGVGGYSITFYNTIEIPVSALRDARYEVPFVAEDFGYFVKNNVIDTSKACERMQCTRQNISYLVNTGKLTPIIADAKEKLFTVGSIERVQE